MVGMAGMAVVVMAVPVVMKVVLRVVIGIHSHE